MSDKNVNIRSNKRKRAVCKTDDSCSLEVNSSNRQIDENSKKLKISESVENYVDNEQQPEEKFDLLKEALKKLHELEDEIADFEEGTEDDDRVEAIDYERLEQNADAFEAEAFGFAVCARETLNYLASQGLTQDCPLVKTLRDRLIGKCQEFKGCKI